MILRRAGAYDARYLAEACVKVARFMRRGETDRFISGFPDEVDAEILSWASESVTSADRAAFIAEEPEGTRIGCIFGGIGPSNLPMSVPGTIGTISLCWVDPEHRRTGIGRALLAEMEKWFRARNIHHLEVAFMAKNDTAREAWTHLGFTPFRVFASKQIDRIDGLASD